MNARRVHAVLAAGVENPTLIASWRQDPELLRGHGIDPAEIDLDALWKFAGLTVKVRHNGIREELPHTFRFLHVAELTIDVFASYAGRCAAEGRRFGDTAEARTRDFVDFLEQWLDLERPSHALLWDLVRHERALARLAGSADPQAGEGASPGAGMPGVGAPAPRRKRAGSKAGAPPTGATVPRLWDGLIVHGMRSDPRAIAELLREKAPRLELVPLEPCCLCYRRDGGEVSIVRLDGSVHYLLSLVDGARTASDLHRALLGGKRPTRGFLQILRELADLGVLLLGPPR